ncbi:MAG: hypothetical protein ACREDR_45895, partial [Blastocatellia bacterium]
AKAKSKSEEQKRRAKAKSKSEERPFVPPFLRQGRQGKKAKNPHTPKKHPERGRRVSQKPFTSQKTFSASRMGHPEKQMLGLRCRPTARLKTGPTKAQAKNSRLVDPFYAEGVMGDVILEIGKAKKHFEDFFVIGGVAIEFALCQGVNRVWRIREKPCEDLFVDQAGFDAPGAHLIGAFDYHLEEVIEADAVNRQGG